MIAANKEKHKLIKELLEETESENDLIEILHKVQDLCGYIPKSTITEIAHTLEIPVATIYGVISFYSRFSIIPKGKYSVNVCMGTACYVKGANNILEAFIESLGIGVGETTDDQMFSIVETRCVGECSLAPVVNINEDVYPLFKLEDVDDLIDKLRKGGANDE